MKFYEISMCWHSNGHKLAHPRRRETLVLVQTEQELNSAVRQLNRKYRASLKPEVGSRCPAGIQRTLEVKEREVTFSGRR